MRGVYLEGPGEVEIPLTDSSILYYHALHWRPWMKRLKCVLLPKLLLKSKPKRRMMFYKVPQLFPTPMSPCQLKI
ncbi:UNVERIFIED_CONTAM: hypothetical protein Slati_0926400 [Sesamum latifolium]|uniref:Uncharacterized protein n=1 Tax=Sesamum latifolium TaxID=2727402 RepID=A0AAW2XPA3_9LAMI